MSFYVKQTGSRIHDFTFRLLPFQYRFWKCKGHNRSQVTCYLRPFISWTSTCLICKSKLFYLLFLTAICPRQCLVKTLNRCEGELMFYAIFQPCVVIYGSQFPQLEEHCSWEWTSNLTLATDNYLSWDSNPSGEGRVVSKQDALTTRPRTLNRT